jgi:bacteriocin-like protein
LNDPKNNQADPEQAQELSEQDLDQISGGGGVIQDFQTQKVKGSTVNINFNTTSQKV